MKSRLGILLFLLAALLPAEDRFALHDGERVLFLGDSITQAGTYVEYIEAFLLTRFPDARFDVIRLGLSSETVSGLSEPDHPFPRPDLHERLDRALAKTRPNVVVACYGMNDGIYHPFSGERFAAYQQGIRKLIVKVKAAGARMVLLTPPPFDALPKKRTTVGPNAPQFGYRTPFLDYDAVLARYAAWLLTLAGEDIQVIDLHTAVGDYVARRRQTEPGFTLAPDGIHPDALGHWLMARAILEAWHAPELVGELGLGWQQSKLPLAIDPRWDGGALNRYRLKASQPGCRRCRLFEGEVLLGKVDAEEFARGVDLLKFPALSTHRRSREVLELVVQRSKLLAPAWLAEVGHKRPDAPKALPLAQASAQAATLESSARALSQPVTISFHARP